MTRPARFDHPEHRLWVATENRCIIGYGCAGDVVACHARLSEGVPEDERGGTGFKPHDKWTFAGCDKHHKQADSGLRSFENKYGVKLITTAKRLWAESPHGARTEETD